MRVRKKLQAVSSRPRLSVFRSNKHIWAQIIDDNKGVTLAAVNDKKLKGSELTKTQKAAIVGELVAQIALKNKIKKVTFDRGSYKYHGRIKSLAQAARKEGLEF